MDFRSVYSIISLLPYKARKAIVTACRIGAPADLYTRSDHGAYTLVIEPLNNLDVLSERNVRAIDIRWKSRLLNMTTSPIYSGLIINLCFAARMTEAEVKEIRALSVMAETSVMETQRRGETINWEVLFNDRAETHRNFLSPMASGNPAMIKAIHDTLTGFRKSVHLRKVLPVCKEKSVSSETASRYRRVLEDHRLPEDHDQITSRKLLWMYTKYGVRVRGPVEMRQKWYPTGLKPRTYFAQGGEAYFDAMYLRNILNELADGFEPCNRFARTSSDRLRKLRDTDEIFIYDYTSFTSNFAEQINFLRHLADFLRGTLIYSIGPEFRPKEIELGSALDVYIDKLNDRPEYICGTGLPEQIGGLIHRHRTAGFLGVYGNLITCTIPHAYVASQFVDDNQNASIAGDDAFLVLAVGLWTTAMVTLLLLGSFAPEKTYTETPCSYLKRPVDVVGSTIRLREMIVAPNMVTAALSDPSSNDPRFRGMSGLLASEARKSFITSVIAFLHRLDLYEHKISPSEVLFIQETLDYCYGKAKLSVLGGIVDEHSDIDHDSSINYSSIRYPPIPHFDEGETLSPVKSWRYWKDGEGRVVPKRKRIPLCACSANQTFAANSTPALKLLVQLGYLSQELETEWIPESMDVRFSEGLLDPEETYFDIPYHYDYADPMVYTYSWVDEIPLGSKRWLGLCDVNACREFIPGITQMDIIDEFPDLYERKRKVVDTPDDMFEFTLDYDDTGSTKRRRVYGHMRDEMDEVMEEGVSNLFRSDVESIRPSKGRQAVRDEF